MAKEMVNTKHVFLQCMCAIYMASFSSVYLQIPGLYGEKGILPAHLLTEDSASLKECFTQRKSLLCLRSYLGLNTSHMLEFIALFGTILSFVGFLWEKYCTNILFAILWTCYLSIFQIGQTFLWFQWDTLLLDVGFLTIFVASFVNDKYPKYRPRNLVTMWIIRWALFRLLFASGIVKLQSGCPTWWGLTALNVHYESQCLPTPIAWYAHHLPNWLHKLCVVGTYIVEIPVTLLIFSPIRGHRLFSFYAQVFFQLCIILTGNYNFFNILTMVMCIALLDDVHLGFRRDYDLTNGLFKKLKTLLYLALKWLGFGVLVYYSLAYFSIRISPNGWIDSDIVFSRSQFDSWVSKVVPLSMALGAASLLLTIAEALTSSLFEVKGGLKKLAALFTTLGYSLVVVILFGMSLVPFSTLHPPSKDLIWPAFRQWHDTTKDLQLSSSYGLFRHMTGVGGRPEIIIEGSNKPEGPWIEFEFPYKPGKLDRAPPFVAPHQPRVDWQMWFAALGSYKQNPWLLSMVHRILTGEKSVLNFLDRNSPWRQKPPKYIRIQKYLYHYTSNSSSKNWWKRELVEEYMPTYSKDHKPFLDYLRRMKLIEQKEPPSKSKILVGILDSARETFNILEPHMVIFSLYIAAFIVAVTKRKFF